MAHVSVAFDTELCQRSDCIFRRILTLAIGILKNLNKILTRPHYYYSEFGIKSAIGILYSNSGFCMAGKQKLLRLTTQEV